MKHIKMMIAILALSLTFVACDADQNTASENEDVEVLLAGNEYTAAYVCPMHCEGSGSDEMGNCPVCGMDYVMNEEHEADGHHHDGDHSHEHGDDHDHDHDDEDHNH